MSADQLYTVVALGLWLLGFAGLLLTRQAIRRVIAVNIMGSGVFLIFVAESSRQQDPVPQALVLTGLVVAVSATALALRLTSACEHEQSHEREAEEDAQL